MSVSVCEIENDRGEGKEEKWQKRHTYMGGRNKQHVMILLKYQAQKN